MTTIAQLKRINADRGNYFFERAAIRFFDSHVGRKAWTLPEGWAFVTSEQFDRDHPRLYTARFMRRDGFVTEFAGSKFQQFASAKAARAFIERTILNSQEDK